MNPHAHKPLMLADALALLVDADAPWRTRASVTLSDALHAAALAGVSATLQSVESPHVQPITIELHGDVPTFLLARVDKQPAALTVGSLRQVEDGVFEAVIRQPASSIAFTLILAVSNEQVELPVIAGNRAAIQQLGWGESALGARTEVRVSGRLLAEELKRLAASDRSVGSALPNCQAE